MTYAYFLGRLKSVTLVFDALSYLRLSSKRKSVQKGYLLS